MKIIDCGGQGSEQWKQARCGLITCSCIGDVMSRSRDGKTEGTTRKNYKYKLVCERMTGRVCDNGYKSSAMENGVKMEPFTRAAYEMRSGVLVQQVDLVMHPTIRNFACSPDGLIVGEDGGCEIKNGYPATHLTWFEAGRAPSEYRKQMLGGMSCCEKSYWVFISGCAELDAPLDLFTARIERTASVDEEIKEIENAVIKFDLELEETIAKLREMSHV